ncbi:hypothetical protein [Lysinibacillus sphaericus]
MIAFIVFMAEVFVVFISAFIFFMTATFVFVVVFVIFTTATFVDLVFVNVDFIIPLVVFIIGMIINNTVFVGFMTFIVIAIHHVSFVLHCQLPFLIVK